MKRFLVLLCLFTMIGGTALLLMGCPSPVVMVRPPEPRVEVYGTPPYPDAIWRLGYWAHQGGEWVWVPGHWVRPPRPHAIWVPGHWEEKRGGWVWIQGHWVYR